MPRPSPEDAKTLARLRREDQLEDLRDGRVRRPVRIESAKRYSRKSKYPARQEPL